MSITITDTNLLAQLTGASGYIELREPGGRVIGTFFQEGYGKPPPGMKSPISDEEFEEARKQTGGRSLAEILRDLEQKHGRR